MHDRFLEAESTNARLRERMERLVAPLQDAVITHIEVNERHGVGALTKLIFGKDPHVLSIRSQDHFHGVQQFGESALRLSHEYSRRAVYSGVLGATHGGGLRRVLCIPFYPDDARTAVAIKDIHGVPLCTYLMDDQNVCVRGIPDDLMRELLAKSDLRLAISPELRTAYEAKFGLPFWFLPPVVASEFIRSEPAVLPRAVLDARRGVIVGNIWGQRWLELLRETVRATGIELDWYCNSGLQSNGLDLERLAADGIHAHARVPDEALIAILRERPFAVLPTGTLDEDDDRRFIALLSLPSRIPYIFATSNTPILVLGDERTAAARFVSRTGIGVVAPYDRAELLRAVDRLVQPDVQLRMRRRAAEMAPGFSADGVRDWIWDSLRAGTAVDDRYEKLLLNEP